MTDKATVQELQTDALGCKALCQANWEVCTAYQFNDSDNSCVTYTETYTMMGDHDISYDCFIVKDLALSQEERDEGFQKSTGQCALLDKTKTELYTE